LELDRAQAPLELHLIARHCPSPPSSTSQW